MRRITSILFMLLWLCCKAQQPHLFSSDYDLSSTLINEVIYDHYGNLWVATQDGLNRYDGSKFTIYRHIPGDSTSLSNNFVPTIFEDKDHNLLVGTYHGLQVYNRATDSFTPLTEQHRDDPQNISVSSIAQSPDGKLILGCHYLIKAHISDAGVIRVDEVLHPDSIQNIHRLITTKDGDIWFLQDKKGVGRITKDGTLKYYLRDTNAPTGRCLALGADGSLYMGTREHGLMRYNSQSDSFDWLTKDSPKNFPIQSLYGESDGTLLIGTDGDGLYQYDPSTNKMNSLTDQMPFSRKYKVHSIKRDPYGNLWLGIFQKGLMMVPAHSNAFSLIGQRSEHPMLIGNACVTALFHDADHNLWVGTDNDGLYRLNPDFTSSSHYYGRQYPEIITAVYQDSRKNIWIASYDKGLGQLGKDGAYHNVPMHTPSGKRVQSVFDMQEDGNGGLWVATMGDGLFKYDYATHRAVRYEVNEDYNEWINALVKDPNSDRVYFGTYDGLFAVDGHNIKRLLPQMIVSSIWIDDDGTVWAGTINGLAKVAKDGSNSLIDEVAGLPSVMVHAIEGDGQYLWISTNAGITRFDPKTNKMVNFTGQDGLQGNEFYRNASCRDDHGNLYFGGLNGISYFKPDEIRMVPTKATVRIIDFYVGAEPVKAGSMSNGRLITDRSVGETETFCLGPGEAFFSVDFNMLEAYGSNEPVFAYSLDGADWQNATTMAPMNGGHRLTFNKLSAGKHALKLKAVGEGVECDEKVIYIDIAPMWYATWWAWIIWILIFCGLVFGCYLIYRQRKRQKLIEQEHQREAEIKEAKLQFFTNVSHEIKTPMTLVMSPVEQLMANDSDPERQRNYRTILRNGKRILRLVNEIMDLRKIDNHQMRLSYTHMRLVDFLQDLFTTFQPAAEKKKIDFTFTHDGCDQLEADFDLTNLDKVVMNLLSNAMKYTPDGGKVNLNLTTEEKDGKTWIKISVTDTGIGVPKEERQHIFERFYRVANNKASGTGIGLHLAYKLMQLHDGELEVDDNPEGKGAKFTASFPQKAPVDSNIASNHGQELNSTKVKHELEPQLDSTEELADKVHGRKQATIYIVEDDKEISNYLAQQLSQKYRIQQFENGAEALKAVLKDSPDLLITDVMMPEMDGIEFTRRIRNNIMCNHLPIIMLSAKGQETDIIEGLEEGADEYISKPFSLPILMKRIQNLLDQHQRLKNVYSGSQDQNQKIEIELPPSHDDELMKRVLRVIGENISNSNITIEWIAREVGISRVHLHRKLKEITNQTTRDFVRNIRLQKAAEIMRGTRINVSEVADLVGFKNPNNFSTSFKELFGMTPSEYMNSQSNTPPEK